MKNNTKKTVLFAILSLISTLLYSQNGLDSNGKKNGVWEVKVQGKIAFKGVYNHGLREGKFRTYYLESGELQFDNSFVNDKLQGIQKAYSKSGILLWVANYTNGIKTGKETKYYPNGSIKAELNYTDEGELEGNIKVYDEQGNLLKQNIISKPSERTIN